jgi:polyisoprenoid-binding protein YceI
VLLALVLPAVGSALAALAIPARAPAQEFHVDRHAANVVRFTSRATMEEFQGATERVDGYVLLDGPTLASATGSGPTEIRLEVDLASLDTGIGLRNRHMRDRYLEVAKYPFAVYHGRILRSEPGAGGTYVVTAQGTLDIHGVARARDLTCSVEPRGRGYRAVCAFEILLSDHRIDIPRVMFLKLANEISLELDFSVTPAVPFDRGAR